MGKISDEKKIPVEILENVTDEVREIITLGNQGNGAYDLVVYKEENLNEARLVLKDNHVRYTLRMAIERELKMRNNAKQPNKKIYRADDNWFTPLWWAVVSLFGKGEYKDQRNSDHV